MAQITTISPSTWEATFNRQHYRIVKRQSELTVQRVADGATVKDARELRSLMSFHRWHVRSKRKTSELPTMYAAVDGKGESYE